jgi:hypothetical protein
VFPRGYRGAGRYLFISSHAVYQLDGIGPGATEDTPRRDRERGEPPLTHGFTPGQEQAILARRDGAMPE